MSSDEKKVIYGSEEWVEAFKNKINESEAFLR